MAYKTIKFKDIEVYYTNELNGGGLTFGQDYLRFIPKLSKRKFNRIHEWCAGPGFIGFSLLANGFCDSLCLSDIYPPAVEALKETVKKNKLEDKVSIYLSSFLGDIPENEKWDLVVGNPPHLKKLPKNVTPNWTRLCVDENLNIHRSFYKNIIKYLSEEGIVILQESWQGTAIDDFNEMIAEGGLEIKFAFQSWDRFYYLGTSRHENHIIIKRKPFWKTYNKISKFFGKPVQNYD